MKKALVIGNPNSIFVKQYVLDVLIPAEYAVTLIEEGQMNADYAEDYAVAGVKLEKIPRNILSKIPYVRAVSAAGSVANLLKRKYNEFDVVHIHGLNRLRGMIGRRVRAFARKVIISVWGSELLQASQSESRINRKFYDMADTITVSTIQLKGALESAYQGRYADKTHINRFGLSVFDEIDRIEKTETREDICQIFGIADPGKTLVMVGYNGRPRQKHKEIVDALCGLTPNLLEKITLVFTMTYGCSKEYLVELETAMQNVPCQTVFIKDYMNDTQSARLRCITDVMIHAQPTDAFSASVQETLYCGAVVFNGAWLKYDELDAYGIQLESFDDFEDLQVKFGAFLEKDRREKNLGNKEILRSLSSQESTRQQWRKHLA